MSKICSKCLLALVATLFLLLAQNSTPVYAQSTLGCPLGNEICNPNSVRNIDGTLKICAVVPSWTGLGWVNCEDFTPEPGQANPCSQGVETGSCWNASQARRWFQLSEEQYNQVLEEGQVNMQTHLAAVSNSLLLETDRQVTKGASRINSLNTALLLQPPASSHEYLAYITSKLNPNQPAYAQGVGFTSLSPIIVLWQLFRNVAYLFFVLIFAIVGLMIILRKRIDPRTVVTVQDSLPRIIVALLLVTFSYTLSTLIIDLSELTIRVVGTLFANEGYIAAFGLTDAKLRAIFNANLFTLLAPLANTDDLHIALETLPIPLIGPGSRIPIISDLTTFVVIDLTAFFIQFKILFALLGPYVSIALGVIFSPLYLTLAALPGGGDRVVGWLKSLISNIAIFPAVFTALAIAAVFKGATPTVPNNIWVPDTARDFAGFWSPTVMGNWGGAIGDLIAFGILLATPKLAQDIKEKLSQRPTATGQEVQSALTGGLRRLPIIGGFMGG